MPVSIARDCWITRTSRARSSLRKANRTFPRKRRGSYPRLRVDRASEAFPGFAISVVEGSECVGLSFAVRRAIAKHVAAFVGVSVFPPGDGAKREHAVSITKTTTCLPNAKRWFHLLRLISRDPLAFAMIAASLSRPRLSKKRRIRI